MNRFSLGSCRGLALLAALVAATAIAGCASPVPTQASSAEAVSKLQAVIAGEHRAATNKARDVYRHPLETLSFFGIKPTDTVVELWPFGGWYAEILGPYLRDKGAFYAAAMDPASSNPGDLRYNESFNKMMAARPDLYSKVQVSVLAPGKMQISPDGRADLVVSFRNIHNWVWAEIERDVFAAAFRSLKPGGVLGIVEHRNNDPNFEPKQRGQAYVGEEYAIKLIESVGFKLAGRSDINRNPKDTKDYPRGVWTLPPNYAEGEKDREKYAAIGESDRFTLKFVKPKK
jgi:predicted methyltransferase